MKIFTKQERNIILVLIAFFVLGFSVKLIKEKWFDNPSESLKLIAVSDEIKEVYSDVNNIQEDLFPLNINTATASEFEKIPKIGQTIAGNIIKRREELGGFKSIEELLSVKRIGKSTLKSITPYIEIIKGE
jgi:competence ComEA-like helix-hairpin-helix protein